MNEENFKGLANEMAQLAQLDFDVAEKVAALLRVMAYWLENGPMEEYGWETIFERKLTINTGNDKWATLIFKTQYHDLKSVMTLLGTMMENDYPWMPKKTVIYEKAFIEGDRYAAVEHAIELIPDVRAACEEWLKEKHAASAEKQS